DSSCYLWPKSVPCLVLSHSGSAFDLPCSLTWYKSRSASVVLNELSASSSKIFRRPLHALVPLCPPLDEYCPVAAPCRHVVLRAGFQETGHLPDRDRSVRRW